MSDFLKKIDELQLTEAWITGLSVCKSLIIAVVLWFVGKLLIKGISAAMVKAKADETVRKFAVSVLKSALYLVIILMVLDAFGINTGSLVTVISALGLSLSLALKDNISNIADGGFLLIARPFGVGDNIEVDGVIGTVRHISVYYTRLETSEGIVLIPNNKISKAIIKIRNANENTDSETQ